MALKWKMEKVHFGKVESFELANQKLERYLDLGYEPFFVTSIHENDGFFTWASHFIWLRKQEDV